MQGYANGILTACAIRKDSRCRGAGVSVEVGEKVPDRVGKRSEK
jgi:hypothetical protein